MKRLVPHNVKTFFIFLLGIFLVLTIFSISLARGNLNNPVGIFTFLLDSISLLATVWLFYFISELDLLGGGQIGKGVFLIVLSLFAISLRYILSSLSSLNIAVITDLTHVLDSTLGIKIFRSIVITLLVFGLYYIAKVYQREK